MKYGGSMPHSQGDINNDITVVFVFQCLNIVRTYDVMPYYTVTIRVPTSSSIYPNLIVTITTLILTP